MIPTLRDLVATPGNRVEFVKFEGAITVNGHGPECGGGVPAKLVYEVVSDKDEVLLTFSVPISDTSGATFPAVDHSPVFYMRWIRQELKRQQELQDLLATRGQEE